MRVLLAALASATVALAPVLARDNGQWSDATPDLREWFGSLHNKSGLPCCDTSDGIRLDSLDWEYTGKGYRIRLDSDWLDVPAEKVLTDTNRVGYAIVWIWRGEISFFLPGTLT